MKIQKKLNDDIIQSVVMELSNQIDLVLTPNYEEKTVNILMQDKISNVLDLSETIEADNIGTLIRMLREIWVTLGIKK